MKDLISVQCFLGYRVVNNPIAFTLCLENVSNGISTSAGLEQLFQQIREIKTGIQAVKFGQRNKRTQHSTKSLSYHMLSLKIT